MLITLALLLVACSASAPRDGPEPPLEAASSLSLEAAAAIALPTRTPEECRLPRPGAALGGAGPDVRLVPPPDVPAPPRFEPMPFVKDEALVERLRQILGEEADSYAVVVEDLRTGRGASFNAETVFYAASLFKLFVMYEAFHQHSLGLLEWTDELVMTPYYDGFGLSLRRTALCDALTVARAMQAMMSVSDNAAAVLLQDLVGSENVNRSLGALGLTSSRIDEEMPLTAADLALLLEAIGRGEAVDAEASEEMMALMKAEELDNGLRAELPEDVELAHKTGNWSNATHDVGLVLAPSGTYIIVILSNRDHETALIRQLAGAVFDYYEESAGGPGR